MPIYEYLCTACHHRADILQGIDDPAPDYCPSCGRKGTLRKQFAPPYIHYKGSGWAKKDRGSSSSTRASSKAGSEDAKGKASDEGSGSKESSTAKDSGSGGSGSGGTGSGAGGSD